MGLFQRKRFVWYEPWFFQQRIRPLKAWLLFALLVVVFCGGVGIVLLFAIPAANPLRLLEVTGLTLGLAAALWWVLDGANTRRQAVLYEDSLVVGGDMGKYSYPTTYELAKIPGVAIVLPEESKWPAPALFFRYEGLEQVIGIDSKASLKRLAQAIHGVGIFVQFAGWEPNQESEFAKAFSWEADPANVDEQARMEALPPGTPPLMPVGTIVLMVVRQVWAPVLALLVIAGAVYYGYWHWKNLTIVEAVLMIGIPIGAMFVAGEYYERYAAASASQGVMRSGRKRVKMRSDSQLDPAGELIAVELFPRDQFDKPLPRLHDAGFLQADPGGRRMLLEGMKKRWSIPAGSIQSLAVEEVQVGTPGQSAMGSLQYYVVVRFAAEQDCEFGFRYSQRDFGEFSDVKRAEGAIRLFEAFESILPAPISDRP